MMLLVLTLIAVGVALLALETVLPGLIAGVLGTGCLIGAVAVSYMDFGARVGNMVLLAVGFGLVAGFMVWARYFPESRFARAFISRRTIGDINVEEPELVNQTGVAQTNLRPSGTALINGRRLDVVAESGMIERGTSVKVVAVEGMRVVVRAA